MLTERQSAILKIIVEEYIKRAKPVGSKSICDSLNVSSATVRNEMANLEDLGYLEKTHVSSGRVPSEKGYRYYVDNLMKTKEIIEMTSAELETKIAGLKDELFNLRFQMATGQLENPMKIREVKKSIARIKTIQRQRELKA